jgi:hypothetical protein
VTAERINKYLEKDPSDAQVCEIETLMGYVKTDGNFVFNTCLTMHGDDGDNMLRSLANLSGNRLNIFGAESYVVHSGRYKSGSRLVIKGTLNNDKENKSLGLVESWKTIRTSTGPITHFSGIIVNIDGKSPLDCYENP